MKLIRKDSKAKNKKSKIVGAIAAVLCSAALAFTASAETVNGVSLNLSTDKSAYNSGENVNLNIKVENQSGSSILNVAIKIVLQDGFEFTETPAEITKSLFNNGDELEETLTVKYTKSDDKQKPNDNTKPSTEIYPPTNYPTVNPTYMVNKSDNDETDTTDSEYKPEDISSASGITADGDSIGIIGINTGKFTTVFIISLTIIVGAALLIKNKKNIKKFLSLFFAVVMFIPFCGELGTIEVAAVNGGISAQAVFTYDGKEYAAAAIMTYDYNNNSDPDSISEFEYAQMNIVQGDIYELLNSEEYAALNTDGKIQKVGELLEKHRESGLVNECTYTACSNVYDFEYACGVLGGVMIDEFAEDKNSTETSETEFDTYDVSKSEYTNENIDIINEVANISTYAQNSSTNTRELNILVLDGFEKVPKKESTGKLVLDNRKSNYIGSDGVKTVLEKLDGVNVEVDMDITIEDLLNLNYSSWDIIVFSMHGDIHMEKNDYDWGMLLNDKITEDRLFIKGNNKKYESYEKKKQVGILSSKKGSFPSVRTNFFKANSTSWNAQLVFFECCELFGCTRHSGEDSCINSKTTTYADTFLHIPKSNVSAVVGFHNSVRSKYSLDILKSFISEMYYNKTVQEAFDKSTEGDKKDDGNIEEGPAYPVVIGNSDYKFWKEIKDCEIVLVGNESRLIIYFDDGTSYSTRALLYNFSDIFGHNEHSSGRHGSISYDINAEKKYGGVAKFTITCAIANGNSITKTQYGYTNVDSSAQTQNDIETYSLNESIGEETDTTTNEPTEATEPEDELDTGNTNELVAESESETDTTTEVGNTYQIENFVTE